MSSSPPTHPAPGTAFLPPSLLAVVTFSPCSCYLNATRKPQVCRQNPLTTSCHSTALRLQRQSAPRASEHQGLSVAFGNSIWRGGLEEGSRCPPNPQPWWSSWRFIPCGLKLQDENSRTIKEGVGPFSVHIFLILKIRIPPQPHVVQKGS